MILFHSPLPVPGSQIVQKWQEEGMGEPVTGCKES